MTLWNAASQPIEDVAAARGGPVWFQLYRDPDWSRTLAMISPEPNWEDGETQVVTLSARAPREGAVGVGADSGTGVSPSVYANSCTRGDPLTVEEMEIPDLRPDLFEETNLVVLILRRDEPGWFLRAVTR